jgi:hypothetical protein
MSLWNLFGHQVTQSPFNQLWLLDGGFGEDAFVYYSSWKEDNSIVYRITTNTATVNKFFSQFTPIKANYVFLKVQLSTPCAAYAALQQSAPQQMMPPSDFRDEVGDRTFFTAKPWAAFSGGYIRTFVQRNERNILIEKREINTMRIYTIVWAPNGESRRLEGMEKFIGDKLRGELNVDNWSKLFSSAASITVGGNAA